MIWRAFLWLRPLLLLFLRSVFRLKVENRPPCFDGPLILAPNHISLIDWCFLIACISKKIRFVMRHDYFLPGPIGWLAQRCEIIPVCQAKVSRELLKVAQEEIREALQEGALVCIFAEGQLSRDGQLGPLYPGLVRTAQRYSVPVMPLVLDGLWGTAWGMGRRHGYLFKLWAPVTIRFGEPIEAREITRERLASDLRALLCEVQCERRQGGSEPKPGAVEENRCEKRRPTSRSS